MPLRAAIAAIIVATTLGAAEIAALGQAAPPARALVQLKATLAGHTRNILEFAFSPDGETVATGSEDGTVRLWNSIRANYARRFSVRAEMSLLLAWANG